MESSGIYWHPIYSVLENTFNDTMVLIVANARHMKNVPDKKTDMKDAEWIASLLRAGLLQKSFIPSQKVRELRDLTRYRKSICEEVAAQKNRVEKHLQSCGFKLSSFLSDIFGISGRAIINHLSEYGQISANELESYVKSRAKAKLNEIKLSVNGRMNVHQMQFLKMLLKRLNESYEHLQQIEESINTEVQTFKVKLDQLDAIPGIDIYCCFRHNSRNRSRYECI